MYVDWIERGSKFQEELIFFKNKIIENLSILNEFQPQKFFSASPIFFQSIVIFVLELMLDYKTY